MVKKTSHRLDRPLLRHCLATAPSLAGKVLQLWQPIPHRQNRLGIVEVDTRNEVEAGDRCGKHVHETDGRMIGHQVSAASGAVLPLAERRLLKGGYMLRAQVLDDFSTGCRYVSQNAWHSGFADEVIDDTCRKPMWVSRERLVQDDARHFPVTGCCVLSI